MLLFQHWEPWICISFSQFYHITLLSYSQYCKFFSKPLLWDCSCIRQWLPLLMLAHCVSIHLCLQNEPLSTLQTVVLKHERNSAVSSEQRKPQFTFGCNVHLQQAMNYLNVQLYYLTLKQVTSLVVFHNGSEIFYYLKRKWKLHYHFAAGCILVQGLSLA